MPSDHWAEPRALRSQGPHVVPRSKLKTELPVVVATAARLWSRETTSVLTEHLHLSGFILIYSDAVAMAPTVLNHHS